MSNFWILAGVLLFVGFILALFIYHVFIIDKEVKQFRDIEFPVADYDNSLVLADINIFPKSATPTDTSSSSSDDGSSTESESDHDMQKTFPDDFIHIFDT